MENIYQNGTEKEFYKKFHSKDRAKLYQAYLEFYNFKDNYFHERDFYVLLQKYDLYLFISNPNNLNNYENGSRDLENCMGNCMAYAVYGYTTEHYPKEAILNDYLVDLFDNKFHDNKIKNQTPFSIKTRFLQEMKYYGVNVAEITLEDTYKDCHEGTWNVALYFDKGLYGKKYKDFHFTRQAHDKRWYSKDGGSGAVYTYDQFYTSERYNTLIGIYNLTPGGVPDKSLVEFDTIASRVFDEITSEK